MPERQAVGGTFLADRHDEEGSLTARSTTEIGDALRDQVSIFSRRKE